MTSYATQPYMINVIKKRHILKTYKYIIRNSDNPV